MGNVSSTDESEAGHEKERNRRSRKLLKVPPAPPKSYPDFVTTFVENLHYEFFKSVCSLLIHHSLFWQCRRKDPSFKFLKPKQLQQLIDVTLRKDGTHHLQLLNFLAKIIYYSPRFSHPYHMFQLLCGLDPYSLIGDFLTTFCPSTMSTYADSPVYNIMEEEVSKKLRQLAGYQDGTGDCIFLPGSAMANCYGIYLARHRKFPETKQKGTLHLPPLVIFISHDAHSSFQKAAMYIGIGVDNIVLVKSDDKGQMSIPHLRRAVDACKKEGKVLLMVGATSGTNAFGAFDPLEEIYKVCQQHDMWLHSDGALGGGLIFSEKWRNTYLKGIQLCDSFSGDLHKIGSATQTVTYFMTPHDHILTEALSLGRTGEDFSTFMEGDPKDDYFCTERDSYEKYVDSARRPDALKLFLMIKGKGLRGMEENINAAYEKAEFLLGELERRMELNGRFEPLLDKVECPMVSFYYIPTFLLNVDRTLPEFRDKLKMHTAFLQAELVKNGVMIITAQSIRSSPTFFKLTTYNSALTRKDLIYLLDQIDNYGNSVRLPSEIPGDVELHAKASGLAIPTVRSPHLQKTKEREHKNENIQEPKNEHVKEEPNNYQEQEARNTYENDLQNQNVGK